MSYSNSAPKPFTKYGVGLHNVGSYQVSGMPWITGSTTLGHDEEHKIEFPYVTKSVTVIRHGASGTGKIYIHFNSSKDTVGSHVISGMHFVELDTDEDAYEFKDVKCKEIYISAPNDSNGDREYRVIATLTGIPANQMFALTGSGLTTRGAEASGPTD
tara:strand:+ start:314 stop:787 length:474 start_codon:yes stop_codon:yes gene_type:complete